MLPEVDLTQKLAPEIYVEALPRLQLQLRALTRELYDQRRSLIIVIEGWEASDKGGIIQRLTAELDPRGYEVFRILPATGEERRRHYLWRFWQLLRPADEKQVLVFDRSWYGRVLGERVEELCPEEAWKRAYREINEFEEQLLDFGILIAKFFIHMSREEQLQRLERRRDQPDALWRLTAEDWAENAAWDAWAEAIQDMLLRTSTALAPWTVVPGNDRRFARVKVLEELTRQLSRELAYALVAEKPPAITENTTALGSVKKKKKGKKGKKAPKGKNQKA
ncbi:MAG: hypothetical protein GYA30_14210 [Chloroflexi bacterium]|nr:hypothetical protein [Chloroflexota bacterium]HOS78921.1 hypothetical protein [Anaerolineae bacterium]HQJ10306.1 hypothetical protein [Anaerolineae bacterium]HUM35534.1 hypothetical protein [Anaerolineae bacterium]